MFICGSASFSRQDEDDRVVLSSYPSPKRTARKSLSFCRIGKSYTNKNPYANRGLDKFYALLSELEEKRQMIYTRMGSEAISFVQFVYSNDSDHIKPIVVKVKERKQELAANPNATLSKKSIISAVNSPGIRRSRSAIGSEKVHQDQKNQAPDEKPMLKKKSCLTCSESFKVENLRQPSCSFPMMVVLVLLCLAIFGISFAILCASICWYLIPRVTGDRSSSSQNVRKPKRKEFDRRVSDITKIANKDSSSDAVPITSPKHSDL